MDIVLGRKNVRLQMRIDLDLKDTYEIETCDPERTEFVFSSPVVGGSTVRILVRIRLVRDPFLNEFINLSYGPPIKIDGMTMVDDFASIQHVNLSKALSTVLLCVLRYLESNPEDFIGINGSDFRRSYLYYRIMQRNLPYLKKIFKLSGAKFFVRALRGWDKHSDIKLNFQELIYTPHEINKIPLIDYRYLYNYFFISLK
jgi:hypothetical protein